MVVPGCLSFLQGLLRVHHRSRWSMAFLMFAAKNVVSGWKADFGIQSGFLLQLRVLMGESRFRPNLR